MARFLLSTKLASTWPEIIKMKGEDMGVKERIRGDQIHYHIIARCNNRSRRLKEPQDCKQVLEYLKFYSDKHSCAVHDYTIMPSHIHLLLMTDHGNHIDVVMHDFCLAVTKYYNKSHNRTGHFWRNRYRDKIITDDLYAFACLRYLPRNPYVARLVDKLEDWPWSGYNFYAHGLGSEIITPHPSYLLLGNTNLERQQNYQQLVALDSIPVTAERSIFEGKCNEGTRKYKEVSRKIFKPIKEFLSDNQFSSFDMRKNIKPLP